MRRTAHVDGEEALEVLSIQALVERGVETVAVFGLVDLTMANLVVLGITIAIVSTAGAAVIGTVLAL